MADQQVGTRKVDGPGGGGTDLAALKEWVDQWANLDELIKGSPVHPQVDAWRKQRRELADRIVGEVEDAYSWNSKKNKYVNAVWDQVVGWGFSESVLNARVEEPDPNTGGGGTPNSGGPDTNDGAGSGTDDGDTETTPTKKDRHKDRHKDQGGPHNHSLVPQLGKGDKVMKGQNGKYYVVYSEVIPGTGKTVQFMYEIKEDDLRSGKYGIGMKDVKGTLTRKEIRRKGNFFNFGNVDEIARGQGGKRPFRKFLDGLVEQHPNASWVTDKEVIRIMLQAKVEGHGQSWTDNMLRQTKWWNKLTTDERAWELTSDAEKDKIRQGNRNLLRETLEGQFGSVKWKDYVDEDKMEKWVEAISSGRTDSTVIASRITNIAEDVEGTTAWVSAGESAQADANSLRQYDNAFAYVRERAIDWLGYHHKPDEGMLTSYARRIADGAMSQEDLETLLRKQKSDLFTYLAPDETWTQRASTYKSLFEEITGQSIGYDDKILRDFTARDNDGNVVPDRAMTTDEWERYIKRNDTRWRTSDNFVDQRQGLVNLIQETFTGVGGGF